MFEEYENDLTKIIHGNSLEVLEKSIEDNSIDLIFADPPYNIGKKFSNFMDKWDSDEDYVEWCYKWISLCIKKLKPNGSLCI